MKIQTINGPIEIADATPEIVKRLDSLMPFGFVEFKRPQQNTIYGFVRRRGEEEALCLKQQPIEIKREGAAQIRMINMVMIREAYYRYIKLAFSGAYMACTYMRQRDNQLWESGIAHFIYPSSDGPEASQKPFNGAYDHPFGSGATAMFVGFQDAFKSALKDVPMLPQIGLDIRPVSHLQTFGMDFMVLGTDLLFLCRNLNEDDRSWSNLTFNNIHKVYHLPTFSITSGTDLNPVFPDSSSLN